MMTKMQLGTTGTLFPEKGGHTFSIFCDVSAQVPPLSISTATDRCNSGKKTDH